MLPVWQMDCMPNGDLRLTGETQGSQMVHCPFLITPDKGTKTDTWDIFFLRGEAIRLAEEDRREKSEGSRDLICGLIDISACLLLFLPLFALRTGDVIKNTALLFLNGTPLYILIPYFTLVTATVLCGIATLLMRGRKTVLWSKLKAPFSISLSGAVALIFTITLQPYAAVFALTLLTIKALTLIFHK